MKGFTDSERERIARDLVDEGRELFARFGLERTRIADVTDAVGIGTSTFYQFFDSKEALYLEILTAERLRIAEEIDDATAGSTTLEAEVRATLECVFDELESNPLYYRLLVENELQSVYRRLPEEVVSSYRDRIRAVEIQQSSRWIESDEFRITDPELVRSFFLAITYVTVSKDVLDEAHGAGTYATVREVLIDVLVDGLVES